MDAQNFYKIIIKVLDLSTVNGVLPYNKLAALIKQYGNSLQELPLSVLNNRKFEVKPGVIVHFKSHTDNSVMLKNISFDNTGVKFSYQNTPYSNMEFKSGINQVIFGESDVEILDPANNFIAVAGAVAGFTDSEHHDA